MSAAFGYVDGYVYGQHDALTWMAGIGQDDATLAAFDQRTQMRASLVCLAANLAVAGALCEAWEIGRLRGSLSEAWVSKRQSGARPWHPGCGRSST